MAILISLLAIAVITDILYYKIPNLLILTGLIIGFAYRFQIEKIHGIIDAMFCIVLIFLFLFPFYLMHGIGAGDIKLFCMTAIFLTLKASGRCLISTMVFALIFSLGKMFMQRNFGKRIRYLCTYVENVFLQERIVPYGSKEEMKNHKNVIRLSIPIFCSVVWNTCFIG